MMETEQSTLDKEAISKDLEYLITIEKERLQHTLDRVNRHFNNEFTTLSHKLQSRIEKVRNGQLEPTSQLICELSLPFSDQMRRIREKLNNSIESKQILMNTQMELSKLCELSSEQAAKAKENFSLICDYSKRRQLNISGKDLYTEEVCKHLIKRTFKKTALDVYEVMAAHSLGIPVQQQLRIACVAGGPGSDLTGVLTHLVELGHRSFDCVVYDYNSKTWQQCANSLALLFTNECKKQKKEIKLQLSWSFIDLSNEQSIREILAFKPDIVTCCWALNQQIFKKSLWKILLLQSKSLLVVVDGDRYPIEHLADLCQETSRNFIYSHLQNPRTLIVFP